MSDEEFDSVSESDGVTEVDSSSEEEDTNDNQRNYTWTWSNNTSGLRNIPFTKENKMLFPLLLMAPLLISFSHYGRSSFRNNLSWNKSVCI